MGASSRRRLWLKLRAHGQEVRVYVVNGAIVDEESGRECRAIFDPDTWTVHVAHQSSIEAMKRSLLHELLHVACSAHSGEGHDAAFGGPKSLLPTEREERVISFLEPVLFALLADNKLLRIPAPPRFGGA